MEWTSLNQPVGQVDRRVEVIRAQTTGVRIQRVRKSLCQIFTPIELLVELGHQVDDVEALLTNVPQAGNFVREEILSAFIRLVAHTPELQAYTASKLYTSLRSDISQESLTLAATWVIGEYSEILLEGGLVDEETPKPVNLVFVSLCRA